MSPSRCRLVRFRAAAAVMGFLWAAPAFAHLELLSPPSRYGRAVLKAGPCGQAGGARSANVTVLRPGASLAVEWNEYVNHPGYFRIAFDAAGDDDFRDPVCLAGCTTTTPTFQTASDPSVLLDGIADTKAGGTSQAVVKLPDIECDTCTLQVIQVMFDKPPYTSPGNDIYYQCADLVLSSTANVDGGGTPAPSAAASGSDGGCALSREHRRSKIPLLLVALTAASSVRRRTARRAPSS